MKYINNNIKLDLYFLLANDVLTHLLIYCWI